MTLAFAYIDQVAQAGMRSRPSRAYCARAGSTSDRTHPVGAGFRPAITRGVEAGFKPASTTAPHTAEDRLHQCEYATIHTTAGAGNRH